MLIFTARLYEFWPILASNPLLKLKSNLWPLLSLRSSSLLSFSSWLESNIFIFLDFLNSFSSFVFALKNLLIAYRRKLCYEIGSIKKPKNVSMSSKTPPSLSTKSSIPKILLECIIVTLSRYRADW